MAAVDVTHPGGHVELIVVPGDDITIGGSVRVEESGVPNHYTLTHDVNGGYEPLTYTVLPGGTSAKALVQRWR